MGLLSENTTQGSNSVSTLLNEVCKPFKITPLQKTLYQLETDGLMDILIKHPNRC